MKIASFLSLLLVVVVLMASCTSSRKTGCPMQEQSNYRFRG